MFAGDFWTWLHNAAPAPIQSWGMQLNSLIYSATGWNWTRFIPPITWPMLAVSCVALAIFQRIRSRTA